MIDKKHIGTEMTPHQAEVEKGRLRFFAKAIGETDPVYTDEAAAKAADYRSLPVPPTFLFCLDMERPDPFDMLGMLGVDLGKVLHGEQSFEYKKVACAGDTLRYQTVVKDIYDKKGGALEFIVTETTVTDQTGDEVARLRGSTVVRN